MLIVLAACGDPIQDDLLNYINTDLGALADLETEAITEYDSVIGENYVDDETTYFHIQDVVLPKYRQLVDSLEEIRPETQEVRDIHEVYIKASNLQYNGMVTILDAIETQDLEKITEANQMIEEGKTMLRQMTNDLENLAKEHDVTLEEE